MRLKNKILSICAAALGGLSFTSCGDVLEIKPLTTIVEDNFWNEENDVYNVIAGCYSKLQSQAVIERMIVWGEGRSENFTGSSLIVNNADLNNILKENIVETNGYTTWVDFYSVINTCNVILEKVDAVAAVDPNFAASEVSATKAEAIALRSLCYFYLIRTFGAVPYNTQAYTDDNQEMALRPDSFDVVLDRLIHDLDSVQSFAISVYPEATPEYQHGRITQDAIHAMLCEMYLWKNDYDNCIRYAQMVINSKLQEYQQDLSENGSSSTSMRLYNGYPLVPCTLGQSTSSNTYGNSFNEIFSNGDSDESIFELIYSKDNTNMMQNAAVHELYGNQYTPQGLLNASEYVASDGYLNTFNIWLNKYDVRSRETVRSKGESSAYVAKFAMQSTLAWTQTGTETTKTVWSDLGLYSRYHCQGNWIIYRLSDIMLLMAEAKAMLLSDSAATSDELAKAQEVFDIVNAVNLRSNISSSTANQLNFTAYRTKDALMNLIYDERERELMFEGKRWYDLVRRSRRENNTDYLVSKVSLKGTVEATVLQNRFKRMEAIYWPYNYDERKVNQYLEQNPAFESGTSSSYE